MSGPIQSSKTQTRRQTGKQRARSWTACAPNNSIVSRRTREKSMDSHRGQEGCLRCLRAGQTWLQESSRLGGTRHQPCQSRTSIGVWSHASAGARYFASKRRAYIWNSAVWRVRSKSRHLLAARMRGRSSDSSAGTVTMICSKIRYCELMNMESIQSIRRKYLPVPLK